MDTNTRPADGSIDFSRYSSAQLEELRFTIDPEAYPQNFANLLAELARRQTPDAPSSPDDHAMAGRFTARDGLLGWLQAKRRRSPLYGEGAIEVGQSEVQLRGWQRTWLAMPVRTEISVPLTEIRNVAAEDEWVYFERKRPWRPARHISFKSGSAEATGKLASMLPATQSRGFQKRWSETRELNSRLAQATTRPWITPAIVLANIAVFLAMVAVATEHSFGGFTPQLLIEWGANVGPLTVNGQWWRLFSALFVHFGLLHIALNMWALWNVGCLTERLFGRWVFAFLYVASGAIASLTSIAWDPAHSSVGASGAIFGVFGAFLAFLANRRHDVPGSLIRAHWISTLAFVLFNLLSGALQEGIDNAAHVGGLFAGLVLGTILARPLNVERRRGFPLGRSAAAGAFLVAILFAGLWQVRGTGSQLTAPEQFLRDHQWYVSGETPNLIKWQEIANRSAAGSMSDLELSQRFEQEILPFWKMADERLKKELAEKSTREQQGALPLVAEFAHLRLDWARAIIDATKDRNESRGRDAVRLMQETDLAQARLDRVFLRANMSHRPRALSNSQLVVRIRSWFGKKWDCVREPKWYGPSVAATDARTDGPAIRDAAGCRAQQLFMSGDYETLDSLMKRATASTSDLPDGGSTVAALYGGLSDLFSYGGLAVEQVMGRTSDWRRAVGDSIEAEIVEAMAFQDWAWAARGEGTTSTVSRQAWMVFGHRTEMAATALREIEAQAAQDPVWYQMSLGVALDGSRELPEIRALFDRGVARFPDYMPLQRGMLRILMPRWRGSYEQVDDFINEMSGLNAGGKQDFAKYAQLYSSYAALERDDINIFDDARADWVTMKFGFEKLTKQHPQSDYLLNSFAKFACLANDADEYRKLRPRLEKHTSATAWTEKTTIASCDTKMRAGSAASSTATSLSGK